MTTTTKKMSKKRAKKPGPPRDWFARALAKPSLRREYEFAQASFEFSEQIHFLLEKLNITQADLAERSKVSAPAISKALSGEANLHLRTMSQLASVLEQEIHVILRARAEKPAFTR